MAKRGRPSNKELAKDGKLVVSKTCKICQSPVRNEITQCILRGISSSKIIAEYGHHFNPPLTPVNIHSHKQHVNPETAVVEDRKNALALTPTTEYDETTQALYMQKYNEEFDKAKTADDLYRKRLDNLFYLQREIETLNKLEELNGKLTESEANLRRKMIHDLEFAYRGFNNDLIKHIALDADLYVKQVNIQFIKIVQRAFLTFTRKFIDVLVKEIEDPVIRERLKEQLGDLLDTEVSPVLDPEKIVKAEYEVVDEHKKSQ